MAFIVRNCFYKYLFAILIKFLSIYHQSQIKRIVHSDSDIGRLSMGAQVALGIQHFLLDALF